MAKSKNRSLLLAGLAAGAYAYFSKKENRDKAMAAFNNTKTKVNSYLESQKNNNSDLTHTGHSHPHDTGDNNMVGEGALTSVNYYNGEAQETVGSQEEDSSTKPAVTDTETLRNKFETNN